MSVSEAPISSRTISIILEIKGIDEIIDIGDGEVGPIPEEIQEQIDELYHLVGDKVIYAENITIPTSRWVTSSAVSGYGYSATINMDSVDATYWPVVQFKDSDVLKYDFAPEAKSANEKVTIYCKQKPTTSVTLPIIIPFNIIFSPGDTPATLRFIVEFCVS